MKKISIKFSFLLFINLLLFTSCTIQKRRYSEGFYTKWNNTNKIKIQKNLKKDILVSSNADSIAGSINRKSEAENENSTYFAALNSVPEIIEENKNYFENDSRIDGKCDVILLRTGNEIQAKVTEITPTEIKYKKCDFIDGPTISIDKKDVFMIQYSNGTKDVISTDDTSAKNKREQDDYVSPKPDPEVAEKDKKIEGLGIAGFVLSIIGLFIVGVVLGLLGIIFGAVSLSKIRKYPEKYKNRKGFAIWSIVLGLIAFIGAIIVIVLIV